MSQEKKIDERSSHRAPAGPRKANVLLVDDNPDNLLALEAVLAPLGHNLVKAPSGAEALKRLLDQEFAAILLDVQMSGMDGFETAAMIRDREKSRHTPIIFLTAVSKSEMYVFKGYSHGAVDYIFKPFAPDVLRAKVTVLVDLFNKTQQVKDQSERLRELERAQHEKKVAEVEDQRNRFFSLPTNLMGILGFDGFLQDVNPAWEETLGYNKKELMTRPFIKIVHSDDRGATSAAWETLKAGEAATVGFENRCLCKDGACKWLLWKAVAYPQERLYFLVASDITERKQSEEALRALKDNLEQRVTERTRELTKANKDLTREIAERERAEKELARQAQELQRSNTELEQFAYVASHDLREPLRKVGSFVELLEQRCRGRLGDEADKCIGYIVDGVVRMQALISDLLEFSRVGREAPPATVVDSGAALDAALGNLLVLIKEAGAVVTRERLPEVRADPVQLVRVFQNLVGNAVKFRGKGPPRVHVSAVAKDGVWHFSVRDNGIGIDPQYHARVFDIFRRLHTRAQYPGTGIGLAICKKIVETHRGRIWVESEPEKGATFFFTLPQQEGEAQ